MIEIVNAKTLLNLNPRQWKDFTSPDGSMVYVGRPSRLGNLWSHINAPGCIQVATREEAILNFRAWFAQSREEPKIRWVLDQVYQTFVASQRQHGKFSLVCWCAPLACHAEVIRSHLMTRFGADDEEDLYEGAPDDHP